MLINLIQQMWRRDLTSKYRGSILGFLWIFATPLLLLGVFTLVFNGVFQLKWPQSEQDSAASFAIMTFCGLLFHLMLADVLTRASTHIIEQSNLVTKVVFPLWILPVILTLSASVQWVVSLLLVLLASSWVFGFPSSAWVLILWVLPFWAMVLGMAWALSALGVFLRDLPQTIGLLMTLLMFLSPIFYPLSSVTGSAQAWLALNPMAVIMEGTRDILILDRLPERSDWAYIFMWGLGSLGIGFGLFRSLSSKFADVL